MAKPFTCEGKGLARLPTGPSGQQARETGDVRMYQHVPVVTISRHGPVRPGATPALLTDAI
jgi:hypothetical protein